MRILSIDATPNTIADGVAETITLSLHLRRRQTECQQYQADDKWHQQEATTRRHREREAKGEERTDTRVKEAECGVQTSSEEGCVICE